MSGQKRLEMERSLPPAPQSLLNHVYSKCLEAGLQVNQDDFILIHRIVVDYLANTGEGKKVMLKLLDAEVDQATYMRQYYPKGALGDPQRQLDYRGLVEYRGYIYRGRAVPFSAVEVDHSPDLEICDGCQGRYPKTHCIQTVRYYYGGKERLENLCNRCRMNHEDLKVREESDSRTCQSCENEKCQFHPDRHRELIERQRLEQRVNPATLTNPMARYGAI